MVVGVVVVPVLRDISVSIPRGALTLVLGATGGGKTSLLTALMGEIHTTQGKMREKIEGKADPHTYGVRDQSVAPHV